MPYLEVSEKIKGDKFKVYNLAKEMEKFPQYMKDVKFVKVTERFNNKTITEWKSDLDEAPVWWRELDEFDDETPKITYKLIEGDLDKFEGEWRFEDVSEGTLIILTVDYDFGIPAFDNIIGPILKIKVENNCKMMLHSIKAKIEGEDVSKEGVTAKTEGRSVIRGKLGFPYEENIEGRKK